MILSRPAQQLQADYNLDATDEIQFHGLNETRIIQVGITVPIILLVLILVSFVVLRKLHCGNCRKSASHHMGRAMGGPQGDSVSKNFELTYSTFPPP